MTKPWIYLMDFPGVATQGRDLTYGFPKALARRGLARRAELRAIVPVRIGEK
jgi:hypothetical protein